MNTAWRCPLCDDVYDREEEMFTHLFRWHMRRSDTPAPCPVFRCTCLFEDWSYAYWSRHIEENGGQAGFARHYHDHAMGEGK